MLDLVEEPLDPVPGTTEMLGTIASFLVRRAVRPLAIVTNAVEAVGRGDLDTTDPFEHRKDEIGDIARALIVFKHNESERRRLEDEQKIIELRTAEERATTEHKAEVDKRAAEKKAAAERKAAMHKLAGGSRRRSAAP
jgi:methyl-accepting chemotaxis protein